MWDKVGQLTGCSRSRTHGLITAVIEWTLCTYLLMLNTIFFTANLLLTREDQPPLRWKYFKDYTNQNPLHPVWIVYRMLSCLAAPIVVGCSAHSWSHLLFHLSRISVWSRCQKSSMFRVCSVTELNFWSTYTAKSQQKPGMFSYLLYSSQFVAAEHSVKQQLTT